MYGFVTTIYSSKKYYLLSFESIKSECELPWNFSVVLSVIASPFPESYEPGIFPLSYFK